MKSIARRYLLTSICFLLCWFSLFADVTLPRVIGNHMVLQRDKECRIWGWADKRERVSVEFNGTEKATRADQQGRWMVVFPAMKAGGPYDMYIQHGVEH